MFILCEYSVHLVESLIFVEAKKRLNSLTSIRFTSIASKFKYSVI